jgi:hypothetical protein
MLQFAAADGKNTEKQGYSPSFGFAKGNEISRFFLAFSETKESLRTP